MAFVAHAVGGGLLAVSQVVTSVELGDGQLEFLVLVGYLGPLIAIGLVWMKNYAYGAPLLTASAAAGCWFALYFFFVHESPSNVAVVTGEGSTAYAASAVAVVIGSLVAALAGAWLWYRESDSFRSVVDRAIRPPDARE